MSDRSVSAPVTLSDLEGETGRIKLFLKDLRNYAPTVWPRTTKFAVFGITLVGTGRISKGVSHAHAAYPKGAGKIFLGPL